MRAVSLNARLALDADATDEIEAMLILIEHPELPSPIRLSTDNTERLSTEPLYYGTRSSWRGSNPITEPFLWVVASALLPSDLDDAPAAATIILENVDAEMAALVRSFTTRRPFTWPSSWPRLRISSRPNIPTSCSPRPKSMPAPSRCRSAARRSKTSWCRPGE